MAPPVSRKVVNASEEFLGQRNDDARRASHIAEPVHVLVLDHLPNEFGVDGAQASDSVVDTFDCKHDTPEAQRVRWCDRRFDLDQFWIAKFRQLKPPMTIWSLHHNDVDLDTFEPIDAVYPWTFNWRLAFDRHAKRSEKSDRGSKIVDNDTDVVQSLDRHVTSIVETVRGGQGRPFTRVGRGKLRKGREMGVVKLPESQMDLSAPLVEDIQSPEAGEPGEHPLDHPIGATQVVIGFNTTKGNAGLGFQCFPARTSEGIKKSV